MSVRVLDCTLRDGAHINEGRFGSSTIVEVISSLIEANIDLIEIGFLEDCEYSQGFTYFDEVFQAEAILNNILKNSSKIGMMLRTDRCSFDKLVASNSLDFIRISFYREHMPQVKDYAKKIIELGYELYLNPIAITTYSEDEIRRMISELNLIAPSGVSVVDTFGALTKSQFDDVFEIFDRLLSGSITLGVHLHENLSSSLQLATSVVSNCKRDMIIDTSIAGMGRVPGNLPTELIADYLNRHNGKKYDIGKIIKVSDEHIVDFKQVNTWGYNSIYMYSAMLNIDRSFPEYFEKMWYNVLQNLELQGMVKELGFGNRFFRKNADAVISKASFDI